MIRFLIIFFVAFDIYFSCLSASESQFDLEVSTFKTRRSAKIGRPAKVSAPYSGKRRWTEEEEKALVKYVKENGSQSWKGFARRHGFESKQCREHYGVIVGRKVQWTPQLETEFRKQHAIYGNQWVKISEAMRIATITEKLPDGILCPDNMLKNKYNNSLRRGDVIADKTVDDEDEEEKETVYADGCDLSHTVAPVSLSHARSHLKRKVSDGALLDSKGGTVQISSPSRAQPPRNAKTKHRFIKDDTLGESIDDTFDDKELGRVEGIPLLTVPLMIGNVPKSVEPSHSSTEDASEESSDDAPSVDDKGLGDDKGTVPVLRFVSPLAVSLAVSSVVDASKGIASDTLVPMQNDGVLIDDPEFWNLIDNLL